MAGLRDAYQRDLQNLHDQVLILGSVVEKAIDRSVQSLVQRDFDLARAVIEVDGHVAVCFWAPVVRIVRV